ncbi:sugar phosphate isomerase/epimerase family protein [Cohnella terricola]|uniref:Sugar phosphate isomerase/epimerase n=1 Tax=Cohnella terricola TaxID=1289167 RepID=A0A559JBY3_9BACL|nr:sugar phosphate isomerase/epimerase family protein [Cohnella terricola]TVX97394.1 sugar phosphate isomerase/epimerase [Cohnella terricola]
MIKGLTRAGLGLIGDDTALIEQAAEYGFQAVEADAGHLIGKYGLEGAADLLKTNGIALANMSLNVEWRGTEEQFRAGLVALASEAKASASLGCLTCSTYILPSTDQPSAAFTVAAVRRLRQIASVLDAYGMRFALEFVGSHHLRTLFRNPFIYTMEDTLQLIDAIGSANVGMLLDSYHWYTNGLGREDIEKLSPHQVVYVHINDAKDAPIEQLLDNDRLYPGEGVIDLLGFLQSLRTIGYKGVVAQEVIQRQPVELTGSQSLQRTKSCFDRLFDGLG